MRIRWSRVAGAVLAVVGGVPALGMAAMWLSSPSPSAVARSAPGPGPCTTSEVLEGGLALHEPAEGIDESDRLAADVLLGAARCANVAEIDLERLFEVFELSRDGLGWIAAEVPAEEALDHALDVWELAADQRQAGALVNVGVWNALASEARDIVEDHLFDVGTAARADAVRRLVAIAAAPLDWDEVAVRDERSMWQVAGKMVVTPAAWPEFLVMPWMIVQARRGSHPLFGELQDGERVTRVEAAVLAGAAELSMDGFRGQDGCPDTLDVSKELEATAIRLTVDPELCVVAGVHGDQVRMASPWSAVLDALD